ncbi:mitochondrial DNA-directed RNA polymerase [Grosmannia clavigera kw1407]|uniref:DNA-directed RNA polymerase n=1 Tax=Grosmannia clavigera (strain kw1407 / UAMH 11150) TaxID=655863 RepID=F0X893_GROCL|nr:mitochondrial DNA-directed RNA polymerase [Grosmannia clavigera kw1407]EFX05804.1 mitochondrial DNA-directed RNA polymerase [Grosmannia clavigera kw1407]
MALRHLQSAAASSASTLRLAGCGSRRRLLTTLPEPRPWKRKVFRSGLGFLPRERSLATAFGYGPDDEGARDALDGLPNARYPSLYPLPLAGPQPRPLWEIRPHNESSPLVVSEDDGPTAVRQKINARGIPGDVDEMLSVVDACLQVGKLERAALVLKRLSRPEFAAVVDIVDLHNRYLRALLDRLTASPDTAAAEELHKWYEIEIRGKQAQQTPETIAYMLKASLLTAHGARRDRLIDRYMSMAPGDAGLEVLYMTDILNDQDRAAITDICTTYNLEEPQEMTDSTLFEDALRSFSDVEPNAATDTTTAEDALLSDAPEVLGTPQKGMGLRTLKQTLSLFSEIPQGRDIAGLGLAERREIQSRLERDCVTAAVERWRDENEELLKIGMNTSLTTASLNSRLYEWHKDLELRLAQELKKVDLSEATKNKNKEDLDRCLYGPFLQQSATSRLAAVTIVSTLSSLAMQGVDKGVSIGNVITQIAKVAEEDIKLQAEAKQQASHGRKMSARLAAKQAAKQALRKSSVLLRGTKLATAAEAKEDEPVPTLVADREPAAGKEMTWPITIKAKVGAALLSMLLETAKVTAVKEHPETKTLISQQQPAFSRLNQLKRGKKVGMLIANPTLVELMKREPRADFLARHLPMVVEPAPWTRFYKGGFLESPAPLVRVKDSRKDQKMYAEAAIQRGDMDQVLRGLDVLGRTAWKVNRPVFAVMLEAWNTGEEIAEIPPLTPDISVPAEPDSSEDPMKRRQWLKAVKAAENQRSGLHSVRCFTNFQMEIARAFRDQTFYFPHNVDFRGRAYPIPPYFNHMGADNVRGLLTFAKGKQLGESGLRWLQVHLANVFGYDKASLSDRAAFAMENLDKIRDSATAPLTGQRWWLEAEDPWQCLAACFELKAALDLEDPTTYESHLPVHQDGTCNGLQHYAALGGDSWGARQVNLEPSDRPADVYSAVADIVKESIAEDLARGDANAKALTGLIKRKVVKQTVMTNVYGVTFAGARKQVLKQLDALYPTLQADSGIPTMLLASYIATKIFKALSTMFGGAHDIQSWLGEVGGRVCRALTPEQIETIVSGEPEVEEEVEVKGAEVGSEADTETATVPKKRGRPTKASKEAEEVRKTLKAQKAQAAKEAKEVKAAAKAAKAARTASSKTSTKQANDEIMGQFRSTLVWTTPLRMPVVQPYRKAASRTIETCLQDLILSVPSRADPVHKRKQLQAFPPNFIHSLDASHMLLSALECDERGLDFAAVHDSFWTHAADVDTMNRVLRDAFVRIHGEDVVGRLAAEMAARYRGCMYLAQLSRASAAAGRVVAWRKAQGRLTLRDELVLEKRRLDLLQSADEAAVARGRAMVTPASIYAAYEAEAGEVGAEAAIEAEDVTEFNLGSIPVPREKGTNGVVEEEGEMEIEGEVEADSETHNVESHLDADEEDEAEAETEAETATRESAGLFETQLKNLAPKKAKKTAAPKKAPVQIWMPLTFPPIPAKGDFDVRRLRDSDYFFS